MSTQSHDEAEDSFKPFTKAERIQQLNDIDKGITQLLQSAGLALKTLTSSQSQDASTSPLASDCRKAFESASDSYLKTLHTVDVGLRRQIYGLEEADIIPAEKAKGKVSEDQGVFGGRKSGDRKEEAVEGGMEKLDIGWLNSRSGRVGRDMEAELWEKARTFLERLESGKGSERGEQGEEDSDKDMMD